MENRQRTTDILFLGGIESEEKCQPILASYYMYEALPREYIIVSTNMEENMVVFKYMTEHFANDVYNLLKNALKDDKIQLLKIFPNYRGQTDYINSQDLLHRSIFPELHVPVTSNNNGIVRNFYSEPPRFDIPMINYYTTSMVQEYQPTVSRIGTSNIPSLFDLNVPIPDGLSSDRQGRRYRNTRSHNSYSPYSNTRQLQNRDHRGTPRDTRSHNSYSPYSNTRQLQDRYHRNSERHERRYGAVGNNSSRSGASNDPVYGTSTVHMINRNRTRSGAYSNTYNKDTRRSYK